MGRVTDEFTWYLTRTSGLLAWVLSAVAALWGLLLASRVLERRPSSAWLLDLHRHLGTLTIVMTVAHVGAILVDDFVDYTLVEVTAPFTSDLERTAVALGVISMWLLLAVQGTSWMRGRLSIGLWRRVHYSSAPLLGMTALHGWLIGTDADNPLVVIVALILTAEIVFVFVLGLRVRYGRRPLPAAA